MAVHDHRADAEQQKEFSAVPLPRVDPYGVLELLEPMSSVQIGLFASPFLHAALLSHADAASMHILDLCGWALSQREAQSA